MKNGIRFTNRACRRVVISAVLALLLMPASLEAQQKITLSGSVRDDSGKVLAGATVVEKGTGNGTSTGVEGRFELTVDSGATLSVTYIGYVAQDIAVRNRSVINIVLEENAQDIDDVVVVAYGSQKKATLTGAVAAIGSRELIQTRNSNTENMLTGKIAGLRVVQRNAEPGNFDTNINIRHFGAPLVVIDGVPRDNLARIDANDIESISVIKDASAAVYGVRASDGVIIVSTKKGNEGRMQLSYSGNLTFSTSSGLPRSLDALQYMTMTNEGTMRNIDNPTRTFDDAAFEAYRNGSRASTDWYKAAIRDITPSQQHTVSASGGNDKADYFMSIGYMNQEGFYKSGDLTYEKFTVRSNVSAEVVKGLRLGMNIWGAIDDKKQPWDNPDWIIRAVWRQRPIDTVYANDNPGYYAKTSLDGYNPVALSSSELTGYQQYKNKFIQSSFTADYRVPFVEGLNARLMLSYDYTIRDNKKYEKSYNTYEYDAVNDYYRPNMNHAPSKVRREFYSKDDVLWNASLNYANTFGRHNVSALVLFEESDHKGDNFFALRKLVLDIDELMAGLSEDQEASMNSGNLYRNATRAYVGRFNYAFANKYLAEFSFRYDMSSRFPSNKRGGFFPGGSVAWRISEEGFWKNSRVLASVNEFKLRASYGMMGRDASLDFQFLTGYVYPSGGYVFDGEYIPGLGSRGLANPNLTWENCYTADIGVDIEAWHGLLGITFDVFQRRKTDIFGTRVQSLPGIVGESLPQENLNSELTRGYDMALSHRNRIGELLYSVTGNLSFAFTRNQYQERARSGNSYENWMNNGNYRNSEIWMGWGADGQYGSWEEIWNSAVFVDRGVLPGDYRYIDWNRDGVIDDHDKHPIGYKGLPQIYFGLTVDFTWKGIDFSMLWQGAGRRFVQYSEILRQPLWGGGNSLGFFSDRWHPADPTAHPYDPATQWVSGKYAYGNMISRDDSEFSMENAAYLRLKSVELGYTLPRKWTKGAGISSVRFYANIYNALTFSKLKYVDPEHLSDGNGLLYPISRTFNFGIDVKF